MAVTLKLFLLTALLSSAAKATRPLEYPKSSLESRLQWDDSSKCWDSLLELQACSSEIILFFLNGETYLGPPCCQAIRTIQHQCWPAMLASLGFTSQEGDILEGYCDATAPPPPPPTATSIVPLKDQLAP